MAIPVITPVHPQQQSGLQGTTFQLADDKFQRRMVMSIEGDWGTGKTDLALTAPGPIAFFRFDLNSDYTIAKYAKLKKIYKSNIDIPDADSPKAKDLAETAWGMFKRDHEAAVRSNEIRTIVWDTATEIWELCRLAAFGKLSNVMPHHYVSVNNSYRALIRLAYESNTNLILVHRLKPEWENVVGRDGQEKGKKTGRMERAGFADIGFAVQVMVRTYFNRDDESPFQMKVLKCTQNPMITNNVYGQVADLRMNAFPILAVDVFPDSSFTEWE